MAGETWEGFYYDSTKTRSDESDKIDSDYSSTDAEPDEAVDKIILLLNNQLVLTCLKSTTKIVERQFDLPCGFSKNVSSKERVKPCYFYAFKYHNSDLSWKFHWNSSSRSEVLKNFFVNISYFHRFSSIFWIFWHFLVTEKLITPPAYNSQLIAFFQFQHTLNRLFNNCTKLYWY